MYLCIFYHFHTSQPIPDHTPNIGSEQQVEDIREQSDQYDGHQDGSSNHSHELYMESDTEGPNFPTKNDLEDQTELISHLPIWRLMSAAPYILFKIILPTPDFQHHT